MDLGVWIVIGVLAVSFVLFMAAAREIEQRHERWEQFRHPPDSVEKFDEDDE